MSSESTIPSAATPDVCTVAILIDGEDVSGAYQVLSISVLHEVNRIPTANILLQDGEASKATFTASDTDQFIPGKSIEIQLGYRSENETVFKGIVIKHGIKIRKSGSVLSVDCRDEAVKMTAGNKSRYFVEQKDSDIMETIIADYSLQKDVEATQASLKQVVQFNSTDWDFLLCRAEANGQVVIVDEGKIAVAKPSASGSTVLQLAFGSTVLELDAEIDARWQSTGIKASSWNPADQTLLEAEAKEPTATNSGNLTPTDLAKVLGNEAHEYKHSGRVEEPELQAWADARLVKERFSKMRGRARFQGFAAIKPGNIVELSGIGERFVGKVYVSGVRHTVSKGNWETDAQFGLNPELIAETYNLRPLPVEGLLPAVAGLQIGIVTALENDPDGEDRIKIRLPVVSADEEGTWARLATLDAGQERGTYFRPELDDEVIVGFLNDDPRDAVILGMCHSSAKPAPEAAKDTNHLKGYVSREKMKFTFDDEKKVLTLETPAGNKICLSEDAKGISLEDQNGNKITLDDSGITLDSSKDIILKASNDLKIEAANAELSANQSFKASGNSSAELSGASTTIKGDASTIIKGGVVQIN